MAPSSSSRPHARSQSPRKGRVFVGMSGGVDSSVAALLLKRQGYDVVGVFIRCFNVDGCAERDAEDARRVAEKLKIPFYVFDLEEAYKKRVVDYMVKGYAAGVTPNPDVMCNREIKFGLFFERARSMGADFVATGHYVRLEAGPPKRRKTLRIAADKNKDQSYFLWTLAPKQLEACLFPLGDYLKSEVRALAKAAGLHTAAKKDSQGICFLGQVRLEDFLKRYLPERPGRVRSLSGEIVGEHAGAHFYTIGQRHGLGALKHAPGSGAHAPLYVADKDVRTNTVIVAEGAENAALYRRSLRLGEINRFGLAGGTRGAQVFARVRYRQPLAPAWIRIHAKTRSATLVFDEPQKFVAPGQSTVWYSRAGAMLGGGIILDAE